MVSEVRGFFARPTADGTFFDSPYEYDLVWFERPAETSTYRLEYETDRSTGFVNSSKVSGAWTFRSAQVGTEGWTYLPVSSFAFTPALDIDNTARGGTPYLVPVSLKRQPGATPSAVRSIKVDVSFDEGASWQRVPLLLLGGANWVAYVHNPKNDVRSASSAQKASVSLRGAATFADGGSVDYTVIRAYGLR